MEKYSSRQIRTQAISASMAAINPAFVLRNWVAQIAIEAAERGDNSKVRTLMEILSSPYEKKYAAVVRGKYYSISYSSKNH